MKLFYLIVAIPMAVLAFSCKKESSNTANIKNSSTQSIYKRFVDSLDGLTEEQRKVAVNNFDTHNSVKENNTSSNKVLISNVVSPNDDAAFFAGYTKTSSFTNYLSTESLEADLGISSDLYTIEDGSQSGVSGPTKIMKWTMIKNTYGIWYLNSHEQFVSGYNGGSSDIIIKGVKHKYSALVGTTTYVTWMELLEDVGISNRGYAAYTHIEGNLQFSYLIYSLAKPVNATNIWRNLDVF
ncbi:hypothetical protein ACX0G9_30045 [Flavitalea flava]